VKHLAESDKEKTNRLFQGFYGVMKFMRPIIDAPWEKVKGNDLTERENAYFEFVKNNSNVSEVYELESDAHEETSLSEDSHYNIEVRTDGNCSAYESDWCISSQVANFSEILREISERAMTARWNKGVETDSWNFTIEDMDKGAIKTAIQYMKGLHENYNGTDMIAPLKGNYYRFLMTFSTEISQVSLLFLEDLSQFFKSLLEYNHRGTWEAELIEGWLNKEHRMPMLLELLEVADYLQITPLVEILQAFIGTELYSTKKRVLEVIRAEGLAEVY